MTFILQWDLMICKEILTQLKNVIKKSMKKTGNVLLNIIFMILMIEK